MAPKQYVSHPGGHPSSALVERNEPALYTGDKLPHLQHATSDTRAGVTVHDVSYEIAENGRSTSMAPQ